MSASEPSTATHGTTGQPQPNGPGLRFAFQIAAGIAPAIQIARGPHGVVSFIPVTGGTVEGPRLRATILSGGGDWSTERDGIFELDARYLIRAGDGAAIEVRNRGIAHASPEVSAKVAEGEEAALDAVYFRTTPTFRTDAPPHAWLTRHLFVGVGRRFGASRVVLDIFEVL